MLICRNYRGDMDMTAIDKFMPLMMDREEEGNMTPIIQHGINTFIYIKYNNLYCILYVHINCVLVAVLVGLLLHSSSNESST